LNRIAAYAIGNFDFDIRGQSMVQASGLMKGKRGVIMGVANNRSIAWGIAKAIHAQGGEIAFTYQGDALKKRVEPLAAEIGAVLAGDCDVSDEASIDAVFANVEKMWGKIDFLVHAIGFSDKDELTGRYVDTTPGNFAKTMQISVYSFTSVARRAEKLMTDGGSMLTLTYYGAEKVMPNYNVMGVAKAALEASVKYLAVDLGPKNIRVNAVSAGPIKTLAASGIGDFRYILKWNEYNAPLRRTVTIEEVGDVGLYLLSDPSRSVTAEPHQPDSGYNVLGMKAVDAPDISVDKDCRTSGTRLAHLHDPTRPDRVECRRQAARPEGHPAERYRPPPGGWQRPGPQGHSRRHRFRFRFRGEPARAHARDDGDHAPRHGPSSPRLPHRPAPRRSLLRRLGRPYAGGTDGERAGEGRGARPREMELHPARGRGRELRNPLLAGRLVPWRSDAADGLRQPWRRFPRGLPPQRHGRGRGGQHADPPGPHPPARRHGDALALKPPAGDGTGSTARPLDR